METRERPSDEFATFAEDRGTWWVHSRGAWHAARGRGRTRCGRSVDDPPYHYQQVVAEAPETVPLCGHCLAALDAEGEPDGLGELLLQQFRLYYVE